MSLFRSLLVRALRRFAPPKSNRVLPQYRQPSLTNLSVDDVLDAVTRAEQGDTTGLFALYDQMIIENSHLQTEFAKRKLAVLGDPLTATPASKSQEDIDAAKWVEDWIDDTHDLLTWEIHMMDSIGYPVKLLSIWFPPGGEKRRYTACLSPVDAELLDFRTGRMQVFDVIDGVKQGTSHEVTPDRYVIHRGHLLTLPDSWGGPFRCLLGWHLISHTTPQWWAQFLERLGAPFLVGYTSSADDADRYKLEEAFGQALRLFGVVVDAGTRVEMVQANAQGSGEAHEKLHDKCCREISKLISGQTSGSDVQKTGSLGNSNETHEKVRGEFRDWDSARLADTLTKQVIVPLLRMNGLTGRPPKLTFGVIDVQQAQLSAALISALPAAGLELTDDGVRVFSERTGLPLQRLAKPIILQERQAPFSAERDLTLRRADLIAGAQTRLLAATAPRLARQITAVDLPEDILGNGADVLIEYLETSALQGK